MSNPPGYPLPDGELGSDAIVCQLVYLPNRPEYWQAFVSSLHYLATWRAWERDDAKRGKDAASNWRVANELTMECWRMTCLQQLQDDVAAILAIMEIPQACCDPGDYTDGDRYTDRVTDGEDDVPQNIIDAGYAEDAADWDGFDDYKCMISHVTVDQLVVRLNEIAKLVDGSGAILGFTTALAGIIAVIVGTGGLAIVFGIVAGIGATALLYQALTDIDWVDGLADKVVANHNDLICSVYRSDGDTDALSSLNDKIDELFTAPEALILKNMNLGPTLKALYAGRYDQQDIADLLLGAGYELDDFTCDCEQIGEYLHTYDFPGDGMDWVFEGNSYYDGGIGNPPGGVYYKGDWSRCNITAGLLRLQVSLPSTDPLQWVEIHRIKLDYTMTGAGFGDAHLEIEADGGTELEHLPVIVDPSWGSEEFIYDPPLKVFKNSKAIQISPHGTPGFWGKFDNVMIDFDAGSDA